MRNYVYVLIILAMAMTPFTAQAEEGDIFEILKNFSQEVTIPEEVTDVAYIRAIQDLENVSGLTLLIDQFLTERIVNLKVANFYEYSTLQSYHKNGSKQSHVVMTSVLIVNNKILISVFLGNWETAELTMIAQKEVLNSDSMRDFASIIQNK